MRENTDLIEKLISDWNRERPELDAVAMRVVGRIMKLGKNFEKCASDALKSSGIHYSDLDVLATIRRSGAPYELTPKQLLESVLITSGAMTALLYRLTKLKLIYRAPDKNDGRIILVGLTEKGKQLIDKAIKVRFEVAKASVSLLSAKEFKMLSELLKKLTLSLEYQ